jgi:hypothetical protein
VGCDVEHVGCDVGGCTGRWADEVAVGRYAVKGVLHFHVGWTGPWLPHFLTDMEALLDSFLATQVSPPCLCCIPSNPGEPLLFLMCCNHDRDFRGLCCDQGAGCTIRHVNLDQRGCTIRFVNHDQGGCTMRHLNIDQGGCTIRRLCRIPGGVHDSSLIS